MRRLLPIAIFVLLAATLARAAAPDPFPNQPGALSQEEIRAVMEAMMSQLGGEKPLPLVASGKRAPDHLLPAYALFAAPVADYSDRVKTRRQVICNFMKTMSSWQCTKPQTEFRMTAQGIAHVFTHVVDTGPENPRDAVEVADYMYSACFATQFKALGGKKPPPPFNPFPITTVVSHGDGIIVRTGPDDSGDVYQLGKTDRAADGCGFRIVNARMNKTGLALPEGFAKDLAKQEEQGRKEMLAQQQARERQAQQARDAAAGTVDAQEWIATITMFAAMAFGGLSLFLPWLFVKRGRWTAAHVAGILAVACTVSAVISAIFMPTKYNIRIDLLINGALVVMAWMVYGGLAMWAAGKK